MRQKIIQEIFTLTLAGVLLAVASLCVAEPKIENAEDAFLYVNALKTVEEKVQYLLFQGKKFMEKEKYSDAAQVAEYVVTNLDRKSEEAYNLLQEARVKNNERTIVEVNPIEIKF